MNREDINKLWGEAYVNGMLPFEQREKFARLVAAAEREACAKLCDEYVGPGSICADVIRERNEQDQPR